MIGYLFLLIFLLGGIWIVRCLLPGFKPLVRVWLGACLGLVLAMWLPVLFALVCTFNFLAQGLSAAALVAVMALAYVIRDKKTPVATFSKEDKSFAIILAVILVPMVILSGYLQITHTFLEKADGSLWVGQSTYGDLPLHVSFATVLRNSTFPPEYPMFPGGLIGYPFLMDTLSTGLYLLGASLQGSMIVPGILMMALTYLGFLLIAKEITGSKGAMVLAFFLFFINGGLGFIYHFDLAGGEVGQRLNNIFTGYYKTPTNQPVPYNLQWSNVIADIMIPQRTALAGWTVITPCIYLLCHLFAPKNWERQKYSLKQKLPVVGLLGFIAGAMPMIHTHSFLALALMSLGMMGYVLLAGPKKRRLEYFKCFLLYGAMAFVMAMPQMITWTFKQSLHNDLFKMQFHFNWVNNQGAKGSVLLTDNYFWFYLKNIGLPVILLIMALFEKNKTYRFLAIGAFCIFIVAETVQFQPLLYDNNKLIYIWYMLCAFIIADYSVALFKKLKGFRGRWFLAVATCTVFFLSGSLSIGRETVGEYQVFSATDVAAGKFIDENLSYNHKGEKAMFITGTQHLNLVFTLGGTRVVCGPDLWLYFHGFNIAERKEEVRSFYENPEENQGVLEKYGVDYILVSSYERGDYPELRQQEMDRLFTRVYESENGEIIIYSRRLKGGE